VRTETRFWVAEVLEGIEVLERGRLEVVVPDDTVVEEDVAGADRLSRIL